METTVERLIELRSAVEVANEAWFDALKAGANDDDFKAAYKSALSAFREYEATAMAEGLREQCWKCGGRGVIGYGRVFVTATYRSGQQVTDRFCFRCGGSGTEKVRKHRFEAKAPTRMKRWLEAQAAREAEAKEADSKWEQFQHDNPEMARFLTERAGEDDFCDSMVGSVRRWGQLTEKQAAVVEQKMERERQERERQERLKSGGPYPSGRQTVEGEVVSYKSQDSHYGSTFKMLVVLDSGHKAWGSVPEALWRGANELSDAARERGVDLHYGPDDLRVRFTATFSRSDDDPAFGFFKSPSKVEVLGLREGVAA